MGDIFQFQGRAERRRSKTGAVRAPAGAEAFLVQEPSCPGGAEGCECVPSVQFESASGRWWQKEVPKSVAGDDCGNSGIGTHDGSPVRCSGHARMVIPRSGRSKRDGANAIEDSENEIVRVTAHPPASGFEVFVTVGERSGMWLSGMVCGWGSLMVTGG